VIAGLVITILTSVVIPRSAATVVIGSTVSFGLIVIGIVLHWKSLWSRLSFCAVSAIILFCVAYWSWPEPKYLHLTSSQRIRFVDILRSAPGNHNAVRIRCASNEEDICASAAEFIPLFQKAGWTVRDNSVDRGYLAKPVRGVSLEVHGEGVVPNRDDPKWGLWVRWDADYGYILKAFAAVDISCQGPTSEAEIPMGEVAIIFGPAPDRND